MTTPLVVRLITACAIAALTGGCFAEPVEPPPAPADIVGSELHHELRDDAGISSDAGATADPFAESTLRRRVTYLASDELKGRDEGTAESALARQFLIDELTACSVAPQVGGNTFLQPIVGGRGTNVLGWVQGTDAILRDRVVLVGAHYDHLGQSDGAIYNGAQDNAAAVAAVVAVGCAVARTPLSRSVLIALWDAEEPSTFLTDEMGSQYFVAHPTVPLINIDVALALDLVGGNLWGAEQGHNVFGAELSPQVRAALDAAVATPGLIVRAGGLHLVEETPSGHQAWSDYDAFRNNQVPVLFFSDGQNGRYHRASDDVGSLDFQKLAKEARFLNEVTRTLASAAVTPVFQADGADSLRDAETAILMLNEALAPQSGLVAVLGLSSTSKNRLQSDLSAAKAIRTKLAGGGTATSDDVNKLRTGVQRIMCHARRQTFQFVCNLL